MSAKQAFLCNNFADKNLGPSPPKINPQRFVPLSTGPARAASLLRPAFFASNPRRRLHSSFRITGRAGLALTDRRRRPPSVAIPDAPFATLQSEVSGVPSFKAGQGYTISSRRIKFTGSFPRAERNRHQSTGKQRLRFPLRRESAL